MNTSKSLHDLVYATKVPSNKTSSGYEVTFDPDYLLAAIVEAVEGLVDKAVSPETAEMHRFIDEEKLRQAIKEWQ